MKSINYYDTSYSPNEACEFNDIPDCGACYDTGMIDEQVYCDCREGTALCKHDDEDMSNEPPAYDELMESLCDEYRAYGDC